MPRHRLRPAESEVPRSDQGGSSGAGDPTRPGERMERAATDPGGCRWWGTRETTGAPDLDSNRTHLEQTTDENVEVDRKEGERARGSGSAANPPPAAESSSDTRKHRLVLRELPVLVLVALVLSVLIQTFLARVYLIPSESMEPTLHGCTGCTGDRIVVDKVTYRFGAPEPGDVVVFEGPSSWSTHYRSTRSHNVVVRGVETVASWAGLVPPDENDLVKRVIAIEGQTVQCLPGDPAVLVDGEPLDEPYIDRTLRGNDSACQGMFFGPVTVPQGHVWVMGDNRANSKDSRFHLGDDLHGTVPVADIIGKVRFVILPPSRWGTVHAVNPQ